MMLEPAQPEPRSAETNDQQFFCERSGDGQFLPINPLCPGIAHAVPSGDQHPFDHNCVKPVRVVHLSLLVLVG